MITCLDLDDQPWHVLPGSPLFAILQPFVKKGYKKPWLHPRVFETDGAEWPAVEVSGLGSGEYMRLRSSLDCCVTTGSEPAPEEAQ